MTRFPIIALVGHSGSGKTTLMNEMLRRFPDEMFRIKYLTSRPRRDADDDLSYKFLTPGQFLEMEKNCELASMSQYIGHYYGTERAALDAILDKGFGIQAYTQESIENIRKSGYEVLAVKVLPDDVSFRDDEVRRQEDMERDKKDVGYALTIHNSFAPGGLERATEELASFIKSLRRA